MLITELLLGIIILLLAVVVPYVIGFLRAKTHEVLDQVEIKYKLMEDQAMTLDVVDLMSKVSDMAFDIVEAGNQTLVDSLKKEGKFTKEAQEKIKAEAVAKLKSTLSVVAKEALADVVGDLDAWLDTLIESSVHQSKLLSA